MATTYDQSGVIYDQVGFIYDNSTGSASLQCRARILAAPTKTLQCKARIPGSFTCKARIQKSHTEAIQCKATIAHSQYFWIKARIIHPTLQGLGIRARCKTTLQTLSIRAHLLSGLSLRARIQRQQGYPVPGAGDLGFSGFTTTKLLLRSHITQAGIFNQGLTLRTRIIWQRNKLLLSRANIKLCNTIQIKANIRPRFQYSILAGQFNVLGNSVTSLRGIFYINGINTICGISIKASIARTIIKQFTGHFIISPVPFSGPINIITATLNSSSQKILNIKARIGGNPYPTPIPTSVYVFFDTLIEIGNLSTTFELHDVLFASNTLEIFLNGQHFTPNLEYTIVDSTITFQNPVQNGDIVYAFYARRNPIGTSMYNEIPVGTINGSNTNFTVSQAETDLTHIMVYLNGLLQQPTIEYTLVGTNLTMIPAPENGDVLLAAFVQG